FSSAVNSIVLLSPTQTNSPTDRSLMKVTLLGMLFRDPSGVQSATTISHRSASYPAFFCARQASFLPSGLNRGEPSPAGLSFVRPSHFGDVLVTLPRHRS